jgi:hypothetical protein
MGKRRGERRAEEEQAASYAPPPQAPPPTAPPSAAPPQRRGITAEDTARLQELGKLHDQGILTDEEFASQKAAILGG